ASANSEAISFHWRISAPGWTRALPTGKCWKALSRPALLIFSAETAPNFMAALMMLWAHLWPRNGTGWLVRVHCLMKQPHLQRQERGRLRDGATMKSFRTRKSFWV